MITLSDRAAEALYKARLQALRNGNMGQIDGYRLNHVVILVERIQLEERERCARIADEDGANKSAARIRSGDAPVAAAPLPDLAGAAIAKDEPHG